MAILIQTDYPAIRAAIDVSLGESDLTNSIISQTIYKDAAEQDVLDIDASAESRTGENANRVKRAAIYFCAARLCPAVVRITSLSTKVGDMSYSKQTFDPTKRAKELREMAEDELAEVLTPAEETPNRPTFMTVASGTRGR